MNSSCCTPPVFTGTTLPLLDCTYDLGSISRRLRSIYICENVNLSNDGYIRGRTTTGTWTELLGVDNSNNTILGVTASEELHVDVGGTTTWNFVGRQLAGGGGTTPTSSGNLRGYIELFIPNLSQSGLTQYRYGADAYGSSISFCKTRSTSSTAPATTIVTSGDRLGEIIWGGADGFGFIEAAYLTVEVDGVPGLNSMPGRFVFRTTPTGSTAAIDRWYLDSVGDLIQESTNGGSIRVTKALTSVVEPLSTGITAAGTIISDATALTKVINNITTVAANTGVKLWAAKVGSTLVVKNSGASTLKVWPEAAGSSIDGNGAGNSVTLAVQAVGVFYRISSTAWVSSEAPAA